jgi:hypothetical protein
MVGSLLLRDRSMAEGVEASRTKGWAPWPTGLHAAEEKMRKKEEERRKKTGEVEQKKNVEEGERDGDRAASPLPSLPVEGAPTSSLPEQQ